MPTTISKAQSVIAERTDGRRVMDQLDSAMAAVRTYALVEHGRGIPVTREGYALPRRERPVRAGT
jgi:hypothetical protein